MIGIALADHFATVSATHLCDGDLDLDASEVGGTVTWNPPTNPGYAFVEAYAVYLAADADGASKSQIGSDVGVPGGQDVLTVPVDTALAGATHLVVYTKSSLAEQTTPDAWAVVDTARSVNDVDFVDFDLDAAELGGTLTWSPPEILTLVTHYSVYLAEDAAGAGRVQLPTNFAHLAAGTSAQAVPVDTAVGSLTHAVVYTKSSLAEQTTPEALLLADTDASPENADFVDDDLDAGQLGGDLTWDPPKDVALVEDYVVYVHVYIYLSLSLYIYIYI